MDKLDALNDSIAFIESSLTTGINVETLAEQAFFSKTHYQRLFRDIVGQPVMEYVKNRRLQLACREVLGGELAILDIALKYGYDSHEGFTRAFRSYFGVTPSEYRKRRKPTETEAMNMLSNEVLNRVGQKAELISATLGSFVEGAEKLSAKAHETTNPYGAGSKIVARELANLAERVRQFRDESVKSLHTGEISAFEMANKIFAIMGFFDDLAFQMNLLRFFSGIETGRITPPRSEYDTLDAGYNKLCTQLTDKKEHMLSLMHEAIDFLHTDIKQEATNCLTTASELVTKTIEAGKETAASAQAAAEGLGEQGGAFRYICKEVTQTLQVLDTIAQGYSHADNLHTIPVHHGNLAYNMNICAFNASIETARMGDDAKCVTATDKITNYAGVLQNTYYECKTLRESYERLIALTQKKATRSDAEIAKERTNDLIYQCGLLASQFALEAERINSETFRNLAQTANEAYTKLVETKDIATCHQALSQFLQELNKTVAEVEESGSFAYFAQEYGYFLERMVG